MHCTSCDPGIFGHTFKFIKLCNDYTMYSKTGKKHIMTTNNTEYSFDNENVRGGADCANHVQVLEKSYHKEEEARPRKNTDSTVETYESYDPTISDIVSFNNDVDHYHGDDIKSIQLENGFSRILSSHQGTDGNSTSKKDVKEQKLCQNIFKKWFHLIPTFILTTIGWVSLFIIGWADWPAQHKRSGCFETYLTNPECMCEELRTNAIIAQPANTYSNCMFAFGAIFIAWCADTKRFPSAQWWEGNTNLLTKKRYFSLSYCIVLTNIGYSSALFHAGWVEWAGTLDVVGIFIIFLWVDSFIISKFILKRKSSIETIDRITNIHRIGFPIITALLYVLRFTINIPAFIQDIVLFCSGAVMILEIMCLYQYCKEQMIQALIFLITIVTFTLGFMIQRTSKSGSAMCDPTSYLQGHGAWHVLSGLAATMLFFFFLADNFT